MTKFPNYRMCFMKDEAGNMNEIWDAKSANEEKDPMLFFMTIEEAVKYQKNHKNKIFLLDRLSVPQEIIDYIVSNDCLYYY